MVDVPHPKLQLIKESMSGCCIATSFTPDSQSYLLGWSDAEDMGDYTYDFYHRSGQLISSFGDDPGCSEPCWALMANNKLALAHTARFKIYDLTSGQLVATVGPDTNAREMYGHGGGQIAMSPSNDKLAFIPAVNNGSLLAVHVYDAGTLQQIACLHAEPGAALMDPEAYSSLSSELFWGAHSWLLACRPSPNHQPPRGHVQIIVPREASNTYQQAVLHGCEPQQALALSPCASFLLLFDQQSAALEVRDVRSGNLVLSQAVGLPRDACAKHNAKYDFVLLWSSCGSRLIARVRAEEIGFVPKLWASERIMVMQLF